MSRPTVADLTSDHELAVLARKHWLASTPRKVLPETVNQIWKAVESDANSTFNLLLLEQLQALERYLWPLYSDESSDHHALLIALLINIKRLEHLPVWSIFIDRPDEFGEFFRRVTHLSIDQSVSTKVRTRLLCFLIGAYQSLDSGLVRKECAPLVSIGIWQNLHSDQVREKLLAKNTQLQKAWRSSQKKLQAADAGGQARLRFERSWLYTLVLDFLDKVYDVGAPADERQEKLRYCERVLELLCDLQSQLPTRRYVNALLQDLNVLPVIKISPLYVSGDEAAVIREMYGLLEHYHYFPIDDQSGKQLTRAEYETAHNMRIAQLQNVALKLQPEKLKILILANYGSLGEREELLGHVKDLDDTELKKLCESLGLRTTYTDSRIIVQDRAFLDEILVSNIAARPYYSDALMAANILPTEISLCEPAILRTENYDGSHPLAIPKLNLQYLAVGDFLWRAFLLYRSEAFYSIRKHLEDTVKRMKPRLQAGQTKFDGFSRMAIPIGTPAVVEVMPPRVGEDVPAEVKIETILDVSRLQPGLRKEWEDLRQDDVVFLVAICPSERNNRLTNGKSHSALEKIGLSTVRCAEVISVLDENGRTIKHDQDSKDHIDGLSRPKQRRLLLKLDALSYKTDKERADAGKGNVLETINVIIRRRARENNFKPILDTLKQLTMSENVPIPTWLHDVFLGYGDPASASYKRLPNRLRSVDFRDTFQDWQHLVESLPGKTVEPDPTVDASFPPPYVLETVDSAVSAPTAPKLGKKRKRELPDGPPQSAPVPETLKVSTYKPPNMGPYPTDAPKKNKVRFTPAQVDAITSGMQPGLTVIVGPPGTGKTDVTTQIISNIYHNFPQQRTLLVAHSNQALNQLFQKITKLDIDERHLLRLGHGEDDLEIEGSFSKAGRVDSFLERGSQDLAEVQRLAESISAPGAHGSSCETAEYFDEVYIRPRWKKYWDGVENAGSDVVATFPFATFFANLPHPLFPSGASREELLDIAKGCERHMRKIFEELADMRPFEILRHQRDKENYLLVKEARIVAMTTTHAAIRRQDIIRLGFKYDNVIMEEAAQVTEAETFIPLVMQPHHHTHTLQRIVFVGDHLQNSPIIQNAAFRSYAHLEQSLFQRLIRLGVPHTLLDAQGRSRPSIAALCHWRYPHLTNLPITATDPAFVLANAGFRYEYQFINVADYKGQGESEPTPHFLQNLGEAEYAVAIYQYMRLLGYPAERISILSAYAGQRALIRDVLMHRCKGNRLFGMPGWVGTVDKYQGEQNDFIILSLVRTKSPGYLRDLRRLTVALSRARLGLYVLGRREVFESSLELRDAFEGLLERGQKLVLVQGEMFPSKRGVRDEVDEQKVAVMDGVEHMGQYVYDITQAKYQAVKNGKEVLPPLAETDVDSIEDDGEGEDEADDELNGTNGAEAAQ